MNNRIQVDPNLHIGKPCVTGTRITVENVLELINSELSLDEIKLDYYPDLEAPDLKACLELASQLNLRQ
jgi:uncharacterized protein (DUF433 family)